MGPPEKSQRYMPRHCRTAESNSNIELVCHIRWSPVSKYKFFLNLEYLFSCPRYIEPNPLPHPFFHSPIPANRWNQAEQFIIRTFFLDENTPME